MACKANVLPVGSHRSRRSKMRQNCYRALPLSLFELFQTADCTRRVREQKRDLTADPGRAGGDKSVAVKHLPHKKRGHTGLQFMWQMEKLHATCTATDRKLPYSRRSRHTKLQQFDMSVHENKPSKQTNEEKWSVACMAVSQQVPAHICFIWWQQRVTSCKTRRIMTEIAPEVSSQLQGMKKRRWQLQSHNSDTETQ